MRFRLLHGRHQSAGLPAGEGIVSAVDGHTPVVESDKNLAHMFPNKFKRIGDKPRENDEVASSDPVVVTLKAVHKGAGRWDVMKVIDGELSKECVNDEYVKKDEAKAMEARGYQAEEEEAPLDDEDDDDEPVRRARPNSDDDIDDDEE